MDQNVILPAAHPVTSFGVYKKPGFLLALAFGVIIIFVVFAAFPGLDIAFSGMFFSAGSCGDEAFCGEFTYAKSPGFAILRGVFYAMPFAILIAALVINSAVFIRPKPSNWRDAKVASAIVACLVIGPGLIVNGFLKEVVLRSRPRDILPFGGDLPFVPVGQITGMCTNNCSFVSGEASIAPIMVLSILLFPKHWQKPALLVLLPCSFAMALLRVAFGAHFISDVILGYGFTVLIFCVMAQLIHRFARA